MKLCYSMQAKLSLRAKWYKALAVAVVMTLASCNVPTPNAPVTDAELTSTIAASMQPSTCIVSPLKSRKELLRITPVVSSTVTLYQYWSPSGQHFVIDGEQDGQYHSMTAFSTIYAAKQDKSAVIHFSYKWGGIVGWTTDGRYALFGSGDQYGNSAAYAFDTQKWAELGIGFSSRNNCGIGSACEQGIATIAPKTSRIVLGDGNLVNLANLSHTNVLSATGRNSIGLAAWSPDENYLIFTAYQYKDDHTNDFALFLAKGDGTQVRQLSSMETSANSIGWGIGGQCASIVTDNEIYIFDLTHDQVRAWPAR